jgi:hypothetical protein
LITALYFLYLTQQLETYINFGLGRTWPSLTSADEVKAEGINEIGAPGAECDAQAVSSGDIDTIASAETEIRSGDIFSPLIKRSTNFDDSNSAFPRNSGSPA